MCLNTKTLFRSYWAIEVTQVFSGEFLEISKTPFLTENLRWLLLDLRMTQFLRFYIFWISYYIAQGTETVLNILKFIEREKWKPSNV